MLSVHPKTAGRRRDCNKMMQSSKKADVPSSCLLLLLGGLGEPLLLLWSFITYGIMAGQVSDLCLSL